jgi:hypothetical protein
MFGTFDTVDNTRMNQAGVSGKLIKPFDSGHFLNVIRGFFETSSMNESSPFALKKNLKSKITLETLDQDKFQNESSEESQDENSMQFDVSDWVVKDDSDDKTKITQTAKDQDKKNESSSLSLKQKQTNLGQEFLDWGFEVPGFIDGVQADSSQTVLGSVQKSNILFPPKISDQDKTIEDDDSFWMTSETNENIFDKFSQNESTKEIALDKSAGDFDFIIQHEDFSEEKLKNVVQKKLFESEEVFNPNEFENEDSEVSNEKNHILKGAFNLDQIKKELQPIIEKAIQNYFKESIDKVLWEVIPDLAENIVREELQKLAKSVQKQVSAE